MADYMDRDFQTIDEGTKLSEVVAQVERSFFPHFLVLDKGGAHRDLVTYDFETNFNNVFDFKLECIFEIFHIFRMKNKVNRFTRWQC